MDMLWLDPLNRKHRRLLKLETKLFIKLRSSPHHTNLHQTQGPFIYYPEVGSLYFQTTNFQQCYKQGPMLELGLYGAPVLDPYMVS